jgi:proline iminopeptidase
MCVLSLQIREKLNIEKWMVFGGSWGSTLSLAYAEKHTARVAALVLRGIFTLRRKELLFFYQQGTSWVCMYV